MKTKSFAAVALILCPAMLLASCHHLYYSGGAYYGGAGYYDGYGANPYVYSAGVSAAWTPASYDADGFPIYGYSYGRPVYGYTEAGVALFTIAAITAACFVPHWEPAPWYHGHCHYPHGCHRASAPKHCPHDHHPAVRPHGGVNAPIHREMRRDLRENNKRDLKPAPAARPAMSNASRDRRHMTANHAKAPQQEVAKRAQKDIQPMRGNRDNLQQHMNLRPDNNARADRKHQARGPQQRNNADHHAAGQFRPVMQSPLRNNASAQSNRNHAAAAHSFNAPRSSAPSFSAPRAAAPASNRSHAAADHSPRASFGGGHGGHHRR